MSKRAAAQLVFAMRLHGYRVDDAGMTAHAAPLHLLVFTVMMVAIGVPGAAAQSFAGCDLAKMMTAVQPVEETCCGPSFCTDGPPADCSPACAPVFLDFVEDNRACDTMFQAVLGDLESKCRAAVGVAPSEDGCSTDALMPIALLCSGADPTDAEFCRGPCYGSLKPFMAACLAIAPEILRERASETMDTAIAMVTQCEREESCDVNDMCAGKGTLMTDAVVGLGCEAIGGGFVDQSR